MLAPPRRVDAPTWGNPGSAIDDSAVTIVVVTCRCYSGLGFASTAMRPDVNSRRLLQAEVRPCRC